MLLIATAGLCICVLIAVVLVERRRRVRRLSGAPALRELLLGLRELHGPATFHHADARLAVLAYNDGFSLIALDPPAVVRTMGNREVATVELSQVAPATARLDLRLRGGERLDGPFIGDPVQLARIYQALAGSVDITFRRSA
jgi:hypothetical protein